MPHGNPPAQRCPYRSLAGGARIRNAGKARGPNLFVAMAKLAPEWEWFFAAQTGLDSWNAASVSNFPSQPR